VENLFWSGRIVRTRGSGQSGLSTVVAAPSIPLELLEFWSNSLTGKGIFAVIAGFPEAGTEPGTPSRIAMKRTYQASKTRRARTHGFLVRMKTRGGRAVINARRAKGRKRLAV